MTTDDQGEREWMVALCGRERSRGVLRLAEWLAGHASRGRFTVRGVHVITRDAAVAREHPERIERAREHAQQELSEIVAEAGARQSLGKIELIEANTPEDGLREVGRAGGGVLGLVIGRTAGADERALVRLGRTARRLLHDSAVPVVVVGPDLDPERLRSGPVVMATGLTDRCARATAWAQGLADVLQRPLRLAHVAVVPEPPQGGRGVEPATPEPTARRLQAVRERAELALRQWQADHGLEHLPGQVVLGTALAPQLLAHVEELGACLLVCGSRHQQPERPIEPGLSVELASSAPVPVAVVPSSAAATVALEPEAVVPTAHVTPNAPDASEDDIQRSEGEGMVTERAKVSAVDPDAPHHHP